MIDNCEHVTEGVADLVEQIITSTDAHVVCTSRQALGLSGEAIFEVPPLVVSSSGDARHAAAVLLFLDRAREVLPGYEPDDRDVGKIARLCAQLDGVPLAIELAAARLVVQGLDALTSEVIEAVLAPTGSGAGRPPRHRSMQSLVAWGYELLSTDEQLLFSRLGVFAGAFTLRSAAEICCGHDDRLRATAATVLANLVAKSMVVRADAGSTLKLLAPMRSVAWSTTNEDERTLLRRSFVLWYTKFAAEMEVALQTEDEERAAVELAAHFDNLRAAHRMALEDGEAGNAGRIVVSLLRFAERGFRFEVARWAEGSLAVTETPDELRPALHGLLGLRAWMRGDLGTAARHADAGISIEERLGRPLSIQPRMVRLAVAGYEGRFEDAYVEFNIAYRRARELDSTFWQVEILIFSAVGMSIQGNDALAGQIAERAAALARRTGSPTALAWANYALAESVHKDQPDLAVELLDEACRLARCVQNEWVLGVVKASLARQYRLAGRRVDAVVAVLDGLDRWARAENWSEQWRTVREAALMCGSVGRSEDAAILVGAVTSGAAVIPLSPQEAVELAEARLQLERELGIEQFGALTVRGRALVATQPDRIVSRARGAMRSILRALDD
jgi:predicted ATPase